MTSKTDYHLFNNLRFYLLASSFLLSLLVAAFLRLQYQTDLIFYIRLQQVFGLLCIIYWYAALIISPLGHLIGRHRLKTLAFSRRAVGVSAFYFALLHSAIALFSQLGSPNQLSYLPDLFKWSLLGGLVALLILFALAITSFDSVIKVMTFTKWKWLHRLTYTGSLLAMLHLWTIGTHLAYTTIQVAVFAALLVLLGLELYRAINLLNQKRPHLSTSDALIVFIATWAILAMLILAIPRYLKNYHSRHYSSPSSQHDGGHQ